MARVIAQDVATLAGDEPAGAGHLRRAVDLLPVQIREMSGQITLFDGAGFAIATFPQSVPARHRDELFEDALPLLVFANRAGAMRTRLGDGREVIATLRSVARGHLAVVQPLDELRTGLRSWTDTHSVLAFAGVLGIAGLAGASAARGRRARGALRGSARAEARVNTSLTRGRCGLWDWDVSRGRIYWSRSMYGLLGYQQRDEHLGFGEVNALIHSEDGDLAALASCIESESASGIDHDFRMRTAAGTWLWLRARAEVVIDQDDGSRHLVGTVVDISDERGFVERKAMADMRLHDAVEAISEAFVLWDADNRLVLCNSKFRKFHDLPDSVAQPGAAYADIIEAGRSPLVTSHVARANPDEPGSRTLEAQLADGRWLQINERRTKDGGFVSVGTDITGLKTQEERLIQSERNLLGTVTDLRRSRLTLQVQAQQLAELAERYHEQKAQAESANRAKSEFLAKMSHELRTPLNAVIGFAEMMEREVLGPLGHQRYHDYATHIRSSGLGLLNIINDILEISRLEAGHLCLDASPVDVAGVLAGVLRTVGKSAEDKKLRIETLIHPEVSVLADERAVRHVLVHLLENAVKFSRDSGVVRVRVAPAGAAVNIFIEDAGIGIARDFLPRLGRPFEQAEPEFNRALGGAGLGLAISRALTEMNGGALRIRSVEGTGTVVLLRLRACPDMDCSEPQAAGLIPYLQAAE